MIDRGLLEKLQSGLKEVARLCDGDGYFNQQYHRYELVLSQVAQFASPQSRVLDVGAAPGHLALSCALTGLETHCIIYDQNEQWPNAGESDLKTWAQQQGKTLHLRECDIQTQSFPYSDNMFDVVIFTEVLEHLWMFPDKPVKECLRVLKPGGVLILTTPNAASLRNRVLSVLGRTGFTSVDTMINLPIHMRHNREYTMDEVVTLLRLCGFEILRQQFDDWYLWTSVGADGNFRREFKLSSPKQLAKLIYAPVSITVPWARAGLLVIARKRVVDPANATVAVNQ